MFTRYFLIVRRAPEPAQVGQGSWMIEPLPPHCEHGWEIENSPWPWDSMPRPWQRGQTVGDVPGFAPVPWQVLHIAEVGTLSGICAPSTDWAKVIETSASRSRPRSARGERARPPCWPPVVRPPAAPPNRLERMSENEPASNPPGPAPNAPSPPRSYFLRFSASPRMSCAAEICLKRSSAALSPGLRSGWYWRAS